MLARNPGGIMTDQDMTGRVPPTTRLGVVRLRVAEVTRSLPVWQGILGLSVLAQQTDCATLGVGDRPLIVLQGGAGPAPGHKVRGLFHVALHVPERADLARALARLRTAGHPHSGQDHLLSEALYLSDPDGNGIEIALDTPERGRIDVVDGNPVAVTNEGLRHSMLEPLDLNRLLAELPDGDDIRRPVPETSHIGHIHFRTNARDAVFSFYANVIGMLPRINSVSFKFCDTGTALRRHMIAFNTWGGENLPEAGPGAPGVADFGIVLPDQAALDAVKDRLVTAGVHATTTQRGLTCADPEGNVIILSVQSR